VCFSISTAPAFASTSITSNITTDTTWTVAHSPYIVRVPFTDEFNYTPLTVSAGATLTIEPGVVVKFDSYNGITVNGTLRARGTAEQPIYFTSIADDTVGGDSDAATTTPTDAQWVHLQFDDGSVGEFDHVVVRYGGQELSAIPFTGIANNGGTLTIDHSRLSHNGYDGLAQFSGTTHVSHSEFDHQVVGINHEYPGGTLTIDSSHIHDNAQYGVYVSLGTTHITDSDIHNNGIGVYADYDGTVSVHNSSIHSNTTGVETVPDAINQMDAADNWWGAITGPTHASNPSGTGDWVSGNVAFMPFLTSDPFATLPTCTQHCNDNILFLPGIEASRLYNTKGGENRLWEPDGDANTLNLVMNPDGTSLRDDIYTKDILDEAYVPLAGPNIYKSFLHDLDTWKNTDHIIADYSAVPYDWRLTLDDILDYGRQMPDGRLYYSGDLRATSTPYIMQELRRLASTSRTGKVTIIAHSNGGLVAKALLKRLQDTHDPLLENIDTVILVAVPQTGTPSAIGALLHGYNQGIPKDWAGFSLSPETARTVAQNMPSAYNLLPSNQYVTYTDDPVIEFDDSTLLAPWRAKYGDLIHSSERLHNFLTDQSRPVLPTAEAIKNPIIGNVTLLARAETLHNTALDNWTPPSGIRIIEIAGWGEDTVKTIRYYQGTAGVCSERRADSTCVAIVQTPMLDYKPLMTVDGDGTVVVPSALWTTGAERYWVNLKSYNAFGQFRINRKHADIFEVEGLRGFIQNIITNISTTSLPKFISSVQPAGNTDDDRLHFTLHSPLSLHLYDDLGNHTGISTTTGFLEEHIPGSRYERFGGIVYATAPASTTIHVVMHGVDEGSFTLDVEETNGSVVVASTTFAGIPSGTTTIATFTIPQGGGIASSSPLAVDENGDGSVDLLLTPKDGGIALPDIIPPEAVFTFSTTTDDILIFGSDEESVSVSPSPMLSTSTLQYTMSDDSGNTTTLSFKHIKEKENKHERHGHGHVQAQLLSIRYGTLSTTTESIFPNNEIQYEWERTKDGSLKELEQNVKVRKDFTLRAKYDAKKDETRIYFVDKENKEKLEETRMGLVLIRITTKRGALVMGY
jgi:pimeloyl-ACP methyl ester carboxylesterase